jgi:hypothetical protein
LSPGIVIFDVETFLMRLVIRLFSLLCTAIPVLAQETLVRYEELSFSSTLEKSPKLYATYANLENVHSAFPLWPNLSETNIAAIVAESNRTVRK